MLLIPVQVMHSSMRMSLRVIQFLFPELNDEFVYIERVKQEWELVTKTRIVTYACGENTCTRTEIYTEWEWVTRNRTTYHSEKLVN